MKKANLAGLHTATAQFPLEDHSLFPASWFETKDGLGVEGKEMGKEGTAYS